MAKHVVHHVQFEFIVRLRRNFGKNSKKECDFKKEATQTRVVATVAVVAVVAVVASFVEFVAVVDDAPNSLLRPSVRVATRVDGEDVDVRVVGGRNRGISQTTCDG